MGVLKAPLLARPLEGPFGEEGGALKLSDLHRRPEGRGLWKTDLDFSDPLPSTPAMATPFSSGPAGIPRFRRTSVLHPTLGRLGVFLGGSGEPRDGVQLQLLLPARVSPPGLGGLRRGWVKQSFLDVIAWNGSLGLETRLRVGNSGNGGWDGGGVEVAPGGRRWNNSSPSMGSGVTLELGHYLVVIVKMVPTTWTKEIRSSPITSCPPCLFNLFFPLPRSHRGESRKSCRLHQAPTVRGFVRFWCSLPTADTSSFVPLELRVTEASGSPRYHRIIHVNEVGR